jgi:hypothetical protein
MVRDPVCNHKVATLLHTVTPLGLVCRLPLLLASVLKPLETQATANNVDSMDRCKAILSTQEWVDIAAACPPMVNNTEV